MCRQNVSLKAYLGGASLWSAINTVKPFPWLAGSAADIDMMMLINYGGKPVFSGFEGIDLAAIAKQIVLLYGDKWEALIKFQAQAGNIGADNTRKITNSKNTVGKVTNNGTATDKVSAFNSDDLVADGGRDSTSEEDSTVTVTGTTTDETFNYKTAFDNLPLVEQTNIIKSSMNDVVKYLTISVY